MIKNQNSGSNKPHKATKLKLKRPTPVTVAKRHPNSRKHAIFAHCWDCCGGQAEATRFDSEVRKSIKQCSVIDCALYQFRQYKTKKPVTTLASGTGLDLSIKQTGEVNHD